VFISLVDLGPVWINNLIKQLYHKHLP